MSYLKADLVLYIIIQELLHLHKPFRGVLGQVLKRAQKIVLADGRNHDQKGRLVNKYREILGYLTIIGMKEINFL